MSSISIAAIGVIVLIGGVSFVEFKAAPAGRKARTAIQAAAVTTCVLCALTVLAAAFEWLQQ